jgi:hypothetical protein
MPRATTIVLLAGLAVACGDGCDHVPKNAVESCQSNLQVLPAKTDILVVVDDSWSMTEEQENLRQNLSTFVTALADSPIPHDFQIGVTTTSVDNIHGDPDQYPNGTPLDRYGWPVPFPKGTLVAVDPDTAGLILYDPDDGGFGGTRITGLQSVDAFKANVRVGVLGSYKEEPLQAAELALTDPLASGANAGFLRTGARLGLILLTDEDDCSEDPGHFYGTDNDHCHNPAIKAELKSIPGFVSFLDGTISGELRHPVVAVIAGFDPQDLTPIGCHTAYGDSYDNPTRLASLVAAMGVDRSFRGSICDQSFGPSLQRIADLMVPQTMALDGAPPDPHMLVVSLRKADGSRVACPIAAQGEDASQAGAVFTPPQAGQPATLTFQAACRLGSGDRVDLQIICAG